MNIFTVATINLGVQGVTSLVAAASQFNALQGHMQRLQARMGAIRASLVAGGIVGGIGVAMGVGMLRAANAAGELSMNLRAVQVAGHFATREMDTLRETAFKVSGMTARSAAEIADWMRIVETSTNLAAGKLNAIMPTIAKFADVMFFSKKIPFEESVMTGVRFAHLFGMYTGPALEKGLNMLRAASLLVPGGIGEIMTSLTQFGPIARVLKVPPEQQVAAATFLNRLGMGGRGGTGLMNMLLYGLPGAQSLTGSRQKARLESLTALGMTRAGPGGQPIPTFMQAGQVNMMDMFARLATSYQKAIAGKSGDALTLAVSKYAAELQKAFNIRGMRPAALIATIPQSMEQLRMILNEFNKAISITQAQAEFAKEWSYQMSLVKTNLANVFLKILMPFVQGSGPVKLAMMGQALADLADKITPARAILILKIGAGIAGLFTAVGGLLIVNAVFTALAAVNPAIAALVIGMGALAAFFISHPQLAKSIANFGTALIGAIGREWPYVAKFVGTLFRTVGDIIGKAWQESWIGKIINFTAGRLPKFQLPENPILPTPGGPPSMSVKDMLDSASRWLNSTNRLQPLASGVHGYQHGSWNVPPGGGLTHQGEMVLAEPLARLVRRSAGRSGGGSVQIHNNIAIHQQPGEDARALADRLWRMLDEKLRDAARATGTGILHPYVAPSGYG